MYYDSCTGLRVRTSQHARLDPLDREPIRAQSASLVKTFFRAHEVCVALNVVKKLKKVNLCSEIK